MASGLILPELEDFLKETSQRGKERKSTKTDLKKKQQGKRDVVVDDVDDDDDGSKQRAAKP